MDAVIYTDGAVGGPPRPASAGAGYVIIFECDGVWETAPGARPLGSLQTPQEAEYQAVLWALRDAARRGFSEVLIRTDSQLLVNQMNGSSQIDNADLIPLAAKVCALSERFDSLAFEWVPRSRNKSADLLSKAGRLRNKATSEVVAPPASCS